MKRAVRKAISRSREFFGFDPRSVKRMELDWPEALVHLGRCTQVNYSCDKHDEKLREYYHKFEGPVDIFAADAPQGDGREILVLIGNFKITKEGIEG